MARAAVKATPTRPKKATPSNRGYGEKGVAKYDPNKHPRDANGRFLSKGGAAPGAAGAGSKTATKKAAKPPKTKPPKPPAKPRKVGTAKQRKGLADQIRKARAEAKTPEAKKVLLEQARSLRAKRAAWKRGEGKTQVEKLPKPPKPTKVKAEPKPKAPKKAAEQPVKESQAASESYRTFPATDAGVRAADAWGKKASKEWSDSLTKTEADAVRAYGKDTYATLNGLLRGKKWSEIKADPVAYMPAGMTAAKARELLKTTRGAFDKARLPEGVVVYRGIKQGDKLGLGDLDKLPVGHTFTEKGFVSTSLDSQLASEFAGPRSVFASNMLMRIKAPKGTKGAYLDAGGLATFKEAKEVTLAPGAKYRFLGRDKVKGVDGRDMDVLDVEIVP